MSKKALGKGIEALLQSTQNKTGENAPSQIDLHLIKPSLNQPRKSFPDEGLQELSASIKEKGILQPIIVERNPDNTYGIIAGERRFRAAKLAGLDKIPVIIKEFSDSEKLEISLIENIQREDLTPIEEAQAYKNLLDFTKASQEELGKRLGKNRSTIANSIRLLKLPQNMQDALQKGKLTPGHARAILSLEDSALQIILYNSIVSGSLSVREAEVMATKLESKAEDLKEKLGKKKERSTPELEDIKEKFISILGTKIAIKGTLQKGKIEISYYSKEDLERIYEIIAKQAQV
jgi:ParB family chromosome partitioning protein